MAGQRKAEGIALLSVYGGDDDDVGSQGSGYEDESEEEGGGVGTNEDEWAEKNDDDEEGLRARRDPNGAQGTRVTTRIETQTSGSAAGAVPAAARAGLGRVSATAGGLGIVDYAQDEGLALSPDTEDGEYLDDRSLVVDGADQPDNEILRGSPSAAVSPNSGGLQSDDAVIEGSKLQSSESAKVDDQPGGTADQEMEEARSTEPIEFDILNDFLPPKPTVPCSEELQAKVSRYLALKKKTGKSLNEGLRNTKGYRNPDFLQSAVRHYDIDHIGSCFRKEVFDPHGYDQADYFDAIAQEIRREAERKDQERRQNQRVDFVRSSIQGAAAAAKPIVPIVHKVNVVSVATTEIVKTEGRATKKSKWDKVDTDVGRPSQTLSNAADAIAAANAHAALLTASANAGAGYASFAQQRRREAEEKLKVNDKALGSGKQEKKTDRS